MRQQRAWVGAWALMLATVLLTAASGAIVVLGGWPSDVLGTLAFCMVAGINGVLFVLAAGLIARTRAQTQRTSSAPQDISRAA